MFWYYVIKHWNLLENQASKNTIHHKEQCIDYIKMCKRSCSQIWSNGYKIFLKSLICCLCFSGYYKPSSEHSIAISKSKLNYKFQTLQTVIKNYIPTNKIGQGGFGSVYKVIYTFILY